MNIVCISNAPWLGPVWTNKQQISRALINQGHRILYVEPGSNSILHGGKRELEEMEPGLWRFKGVGLTSRWWPVRALSKGLHERQIAQAWQRIGFEPHMVLVYDPERDTGQLRLPDHGLPRVYDMVDHHVSFPCYRRPLASRWIMRRERRLIKSASGVAVTSAPLVDWATSQGARRIRLIPNAAGYAAPCSTGIALPAGVSRPLCITIATVHPEKCDIGLLAVCSRALPAITFLVVGPFASDLSNAQREEILDSLPPNVIFSGPCKPDETATYARLANVCFSPVPVTEHTRYVLPLKLFDYLQSGRPIVTTRLESLRGLDVDINMVSTPAEAIRTIDQAITWPSSSRNQAYAAAHTWNHRAQQLVDFAFELPEISS